MSEREHFRQNENNNVMDMSYSINNSNLSILFTDNSCSGPLQTILEYIDLETIFNLMQLSKYLNNFIGNLEQYWKTIYDNLDQEQKLFDANINDKILHDNVIENKSSINAEHINEIVKIYFAITGLNKFLVPNHNRSIYYLIVHRVLVNNKIKESLLVNNSFEGREYYFPDLYEIRENIKYLEYYEPKFSHLFKFFDYQTDYNYLFEQMFIVFQKNINGIKIKFNTFHLLITFNAVSVTIGQHSTIPIHFSRSELVKHILQTITVLDNKKHYFYFVDYMKSFFENLLIAYYD